MLSFMYGEEVVRETELEHQRAVRQSIEETGRNGRSGGVTYRRVGDVRVDYVYLRDVAIWNSFAAVDYQQVRVRSGQDWRRDGADNFSEGVRSICVG